jgi:hypothetical protein
MILANVPDADSFVEEFGTLPAGVQGKVFRLLAECPHLKGQRLVDKV